MGWEMGGRFKRKGTFVYLQLIHVDVWQKPSQYCRAIILQLKRNNFLKMVSMPTGLRGTSFHRKDGKFLLFASKKRLHHPVPPSLAAPACSLRLPERALPDPLLNPSGWETSPGRIRIRRPASSSHPDKVTEAAATALPARPPRGAGAAKKAETPQ